MIAVVFLVRACDQVSAGMFGKRIENARKRGLTGYDLIDELDVWYGHNSPEYRGPFKVLDELGDANGKVTIADWDAAGLPKAQFAYFDRDHNGLLDVHEAHSWHQQRKPARTMNLSEVHDPPRGHRKPLGSWKDPLPSDDLVYQKPYPHPRDFWRKHMDGYLPAVLKGAQKGWPAMGWTPEVLKERFGWVDVKLEPKIEARGNDTAYKELDRLAPSHRLNISEYLRLEKGKNMYVVSIIPQKMAWEVAHPSVLLCGSRKKILNKRSKPPHAMTEHMYPHESGYSWMTHVFEANLWMASGTTRSQLHYDKEWNVNCLLSGKKRWFFLNPFWYDKELQWSRGRKFKPRDPLNNAWTDWVFLDPDEVDLIVQHKLRKMDYYELIQEAGDCIFIPYAMLHQVQKLDPGFQVAASWMFLPETVYDEEACEEAPLHEDLPLATMDTLYMYTGRGLIPQGYGDPLHLVERIIGMLNQVGKKHLTRKIFAEAVTRGDASLAQIRDAQEKKDRIKRMYDMLTKYASEPKRGLTADEARAVPLRLWCKPAAEGDDEGPLPCDHGQEYHLCDDEEFKVMKDYVDDKLAAKRALGAGQPVPTGEAPTHQRVWTRQRGGDRRTASKGSPRAEL